MLSKILTDAYYLRIRVKATTNLFYRDQKALPVEEVTVVEMELLVRPVSPEVPDKKAHQVLTVRQDQWDHPEILALQA